MAVRSTAGLLVLAALTIGGLLLGSAWRLGAGEARGLRGAEGGTDAGASPAAIDAVVEEASSAREAAATGEPAVEVDTPRPRLVVEVISAGTASPSRPLPGAVIYAVGDDIPLGTTDGGGRLEVELLAETEGVRLRCEARGHSRATTTAHVRDGVARVQLTLQQVALLVGRVRHADGRPAQEHRVAALTEEESRGLEAPAGPRRQGPGTPSTMTDEQGRYELEVVAGRWRLASSSPIGYERPWGWTEVTEAVEGSETRVDDLLVPESSPDHRLEVRVVDRKREAVPHAAIAYELVEAEKRSARGFATSDSEGRFLLTGRPGDAFELTAGASAPGLATGRERGVVGGPPVVIVLGPAPILEVLVRTPVAGEPKHDLSWRLGRVTADGDEWLEFGRCPAEEQGVFATTWPDGADVLEILSVAGYAGERVELPQPPPAGERGRAEVVLREGLRVEGSVRGAARGLAPPLVRARRITQGDLPPDPESWPRRGTAAVRVAEDGRFRLGLREPGAYMLGVTGELRAPLVVGPYEILEPPGVVDLELTLVRPNVDAGSILEGE